jgi:hypothetical protein
MHSVSLSQSEFEVDDDKQAVRGQRQRSGEGKGTLDHLKDDLVLHHLHNRKRQRQTVDPDFVPGIISRNWLLANLELAIDEYKRA